MVTVVRVLAWQKKTARWEGWPVCGTDVSWALALGVIAHEERCEFGLTTPYALLEYCFWISPSS